MKSTANPSRWLAILTDTFRTDATAPPDEPLPPQSARANRRFNLALFLVAWIAIFDLFVQLTNVSALYPVALLLLASPGTTRYLWRFAAVLILLTYGIYVLKNVLFPVEHSMLNYRLINRTFVALTVVVLSWVLQMWFRWRNEQSDPNMPAWERYQEDEIGATFAMLIGAPLAILIAIVDIFSPANMNLAILYPIPLFICGWTRSKRLLWSMLALLLLLAMPGYFLGPPLEDSALQASVDRNRILAILSIIGVTVILNYWMGREERPEL